MASDLPVFFDPKGTRRRWIGRSLIALSVVVALAGTLFVLSLFSSTPDLVAAVKKRIGLPRPLVTPESTAFAQHRARIDRTLLANEIAGSKRRSRPLPPSAGPISMAFYTPWEPAGIDSFRAHAGNLTHLAPTWLHLASNGQDLDLRDYQFSSNPHNADAVQIAREHGVGIVPVLDNSLGGFDGALGARFLLNEAAQRRVTSQVVQFLKEHEYQGLNVDFEDLPAGSGQAYLAFLRRLKASFQPAGLSLSVDLESSQDELDMGELSDIVDWAVLMAYDQHSDNTGPGPIAAASWTESLLDKTLRNFPSSKVVLGVGNYGYDWVKGQAKAESVSFEEALANAHDNRDEPPSDVLEFDDNSLNFHYSYSDESGNAHSVWMLDGVSAYNQLTLGKAAGIRGAAVWALGVEDPSLWTFFTRDALSTHVSPENLRSVSFPYEVSFEGRGEIITVAERPTEGLRNIGTDSDSGLIDEATYVKYAFPYVIKKSGYKPKKLVLTFDDGPDPTYTPAILDELKALRCPGTFFLVGQSAEQNGDLARRIAEEGHEIGSHTYTHPNLGTVGARRAELELNTTLRAIQGLTGRSTTLFRPPYNADSMPETLEQVLPVDIASGHHYITVGENIDPHDWDTTVRLEDGTVRAKTGEDVASAVVSEVLTRQGTDDEGNIILLHDAGGGRKATVDALPLLVPRLRALGYTFVSVGDLLGKTHEEVMPPVSSKDQPVVGLDRIVFKSAYTMESWLAGAFVVAIALGLLRAILLPTLALVASRRQKCLPAIGRKLSVSVAIAAYNEARVIVRTIKSVRASHYPVVEVVVVDDGSTDGTSEAIDEEFGGDPGVRVIRKVNGGKSSALNAALEATSADLMFAVDADTIVDRHAIEKLSRHFGDPKVAAVAGNVEVGNVRNVLTLWQSIEYTTSQNLDRRAYALMNAITVVPGAIGMWRTSALRAVGGYSSDTMAEDMDLTMRLRRAGFRLENEPEAYAKTEAPETFSAFFRQRFRWAFGTLQCLWKHRGALGGCGWFGRFALPSLWVFQVVFLALGPLIDLQVIYSLAGAAFAFLTTSAGSVELETRSLAVENVSRIAFLYAVFFVVEFAAAFVAFRMQGQRTRTLWWLFFQRFAYRQIMYGVIYRSIARALAGSRQSWGKLTRSGNVQADTI